MHAYIHTYISQTVIQQDIVYEQERTAQHIDPNFHHTNHHCPSPLLSNNLCSPTPLLLDKESVKQINRVFSKQIVTDMKDDIVKDPNYDAAKFPNLAAAL